MSEEFDDEEFTDCLGTVWERSLGIPQGHDDCCWCDAPLSGSAVLYDKEGDRAMHLDCFEAHDGFEYASTKEE